jgi:hypothetical protein
MSDRPAQRQTAETVVDLPEITEAKHGASDHAAVWIDLDV